MAARQMERVCDKNKNVLNQDCKIMVFPDSGLKTIRVLSSSLKVNIKPKCDEVFHLNAPADCLFIENPRLDACFQETVDPDPEIIFQGDIHRGSIIFEYEKIAIPPDLF
jgi:hypothetical protein